MLSRSRGNLILDPLSLRTKRGIIYYFPSHASSIGTSCCLFNFSGTLKVSNSTSSPLLSAHDMIRCSVHMIICIHKFIFLHSAKILKTSFKVVPWLLILGRVLPSEINERRSKSLQEESGRISIVDTPYITKGECNRGLW